MTTAALTQHRPVPQIEALALPGCDAPLPVLRDESSQGWLVVATACEGLGIDPRAQQKRLARQAWATPVMMTAVGADGKVREMLALRADKVAMWLATLEASRIANNTVRKRIVAWQEQAADVLDRWVRGTPVVPVPPAPQPANDILLRVLDRIDRQMEEQSKERVVFLQTLTGIVTMVGEMTKRSALPESAAVHVVPPVLEKEWVTTAEACQALRISNVTLYRRLARRGTLSSVRRKPGHRQAGFRGNPPMLWHLADLRLALTGRKSAPIPQKTWTADVPPSNVVPIRPEAIPDQAPVPPKPAFTPGALRAAINIVVHERLQRDGNLKREARHDLWTQIYNVFAAQQKYDPRRERKDKQNALDVVEARGDLGVLLMVAQQVCEIDPTEAGTYNA